MGRQLLFVDGNILIYNCTTILFHSTTSCSDQCWCFAMSQVAYEYATGVGSLIQHLRFLYVNGGGQVVRWCWVNFQCWGVLLIWAIKLVPTQNVCDRKKGITQPKSDGISSKVDQFIYTLIFNYMPNIGILSQTVIQIFCAQGCSYIVHKGS